MNPPKPSRPSPQDQAKLNAQSALVIEQPKLQKEFRDDEFDAELLQLDSKFKKVTHLDSTSHNMPTSVIS